jgi:hypothetical protein
LEDRLRRWLQTRNSGGTAQWLAQLLSAVPPLAMRVLFYVAVGAVLLMAAWILWRELRASGLLEQRSRQGRRRGGRTAAQVPAGTAEPGFADVQAAPQGQRASALLRLLLQALQRAGRLRGERVLSCRELTERAVFDSDDQRRRFAAIAVWAERERYAAQPPDAGVAAALAGAADLYAQLQQPAPSEGAAAP